MEDMIRIELITDEGIKDIHAEKGTKLYEIAEKYYESSKGLMPVLGKVDGENRDLLYGIKRPCRLEFLDMRSRLARLTYQRTIYFLYLIVLNEMMPQASAILKYPLNDGILVRLDRDIDDQVAFYARVEKRMRELVREGIMFERKLFRRSEILGDEPPASVSREQTEFIRNCDVEEIFEYSYNGFSEMFYEPLMQSAKNLTLFELIPYGKGLIIRVPQLENLDHLPEYRDHVSLYETYNTVAVWRELLGVGYLHDLNKKIENGEWHDLILINEAMHEKMIAEAADRIYRENKRIVLIAGPSSSGKTTFAQRLCIQLRVLGLKPLYMGTDDYFVERNMLVPDENGKFNFEDLEAVDVDLFNDHMNALLRGEIVDMPVFDFITGSKRYGTRITQADSDQPIVIEGIHALNPKLTEQIDDSEKFKIYISPLTSLNIDENNRIPVTDIRQLRRMSRDMRSRGRSPRDTIASWGDVRAGEVKNIFPYVEDADLMFNSAFMYELAVIRPIIEEGLKAIPLDAPEYLEAQRLLRILRCVKPLTDTSNVSNNSIMREFIGGGIWVK